MAKSKRKKTTKPRFQKIVWTKEEEAFLKKHREEWLELDGREERNEFCARVGEGIRELQPERYGVVVVARNKQLKEEWDRRVKVCLPTLSNQLYFSAFEFRQLRRGSIITEVLQNKGVSSDLREKSSSGM